MTGFEAYLPAIGKALKSFGAKALLAAIKAWKEKKDDAEKAELAGLIKDVELAKDIDRKIDDRLTAALQKIELSRDQFEKVLTFETDEILKSSLTKLILENTLSADALLQLWVAAYPAFSGSESNLSHLAELLVDAIDRSIAENADAARLLTIRSTRAIRADLVGVSDQLKDQSGLLNAQVTSIQNIEGMLQQLVSQGKSAQAMRVVEREPSVPVELLNSQNARRFERAKQQLLEGSISNASQQFRDLIEDLEGQSDRTDQMLLFRCYLNLGACYWEQDKSPEAVDWFYKAINLFPTDWRSKRHKVLILLAQKDETAALNLLLELIDERPDDVDILANAATILKSLERPEEALALLQKRTFEDSDYYGILATVLNDLNRFSEAEAAARRGLKIDSDSFSSRVALAAAIAIPAIRARSEAATTELAPSDPERRVLLEAAAALEAAYTSVEKSNRMIAFKDALSNLPPIYLLLGDTANAVLWSRETLKVAPNDFSLLVNAWCAEMRATHFDKAALVAERLWILNPSVDSWAKKAFALLQDGKAGEVLKGFERDSTSLPSLQESGEALSLVAEAHSHMHENEQGIALINSALERLGENSALFAARAMLEENLGRSDDAAKSLEKAELVAEGVQRTNVLIDVALFKYRHNEWADAAKRLDALGGSSVYGPLFRPFVVSLFNSRQYQKCVDLCEQAIAELQSPPDIYYVLAARAYFFADNFARARALLDMVLIRGVSNDFNVRKMLAFAYWNLDEGQKVVDIASKVLSEKPDDADLLILLCVTHVRLRRFSDAAEYGLRAVRTAPKDLRTHLSFVRAVYMCPADTELTPEIRQAHFESQQFLLAEGNGVLQSISIDDDFRGLKQLVKERARFVSQIEGDYRKQILPLGVFSRRIGSSEFQIWGALIVSGRPHFKMQTGASEDQARQINSAWDTKIVVDLLGLLTLQLIGHLALLPKLYQHIYVHSSVLDAVLHEIREIEANPTQGNFAYHGGKFYVTERTQAQAAAVLEFLVPIRDFLKSSAVIPTGFFTDTIEDANTKLFLKACGEPSFLPVLIARQQGISLFSDDCAIREVAIAGYGVRGFCSQSLLRVALAKSLLSQADYQKAVLTMIDRNYWFVSTDAGTFEAAYTRANGELTPLNLRLIRQISNPNYNRETLVPMLARFAMYLWRRHDANSTKTNLVWMSEIWFAIVQAPKNAELLYRMHMNIAANSLTMPAVYYGIANWAVNQIPFIRDRRRAFLKMICVTADSAEKVVRAQFGPQGDYAGQWRLLRLMRNRIF
jgi:tetratricopeptide (TPR) repeat protein